MKLATALLLALVVFSVGARVARTESALCLTREEAIVLIAHKADVEHGGRVSKWRIWAIADRESGLNHCAGGQIKVSPTHDRGLLQMNPRGVWGNCLVNRYCNRPDLIDDAEYQIDVLMNYYERYGDFCPWNPKGNYLPGCGYR